MRQFEERLLRLPEVMRRTKLTKSGVYYAIRRPKEKGGGFPRPFAFRLRKPGKANGRAVGWAEQEVQDWLDRRAASQEQEQEREEGTTP